MKRMNEVFDLPVYADGELLKGRYYANCAMFLSAEECFVAAHAINHVDALADALADLLDEVEFTRSNVWTLNAKAALAAYRGKP